MAAIHSNGGNRWNILGFNFTKRDALSIVYNIRYLCMQYYNTTTINCQLTTFSGIILASETINPQLI